MFSLLIVIIYISFISLGLPDAITGAAWPTMNSELDVPLSYAGLLTMIISCGTVVSSLLSDRLTKKLGVGRVTAFSVMLTALALFGFSLSDRMWMLLLFAIPYGLGAGAVDSALNNYVALHYSSRYMSLLHCFWGVGALVGPFVMGAFLSSNGNWRGGYRFVSYIQIILTAVLIIALPLWNIRNKSDMAEKVSLKPKPLRVVLKIKGVPYIMCAFFCYCGMEATAGLWASSYMVYYKGVDSITAARFASLFYIGITAGRFLCSFITDKVGDKNMIKYSTFIAASGILLIMLPFTTPTPALFGLITVGVGCAPIYPCIIHATPANFGRDNSQALVGVQMASAYVGCVVLPPLFGIIARNITISLYPFFLFIFCALIFIMTEKLNGVSRTAKQ